MVAQNRIIVVGGIEENGTMRRSPSSTTPPDVEYQNGVVTVGHNTGLSVVTAMVKSTVWSKKVNVVLEQEQ